MKSEHFQQPGKSRELQGGGDGRGQRQRQAAVALWVEKSHPHPWAPLQGFGDQWGLGVMLQLFPLSLWGAVAPARA